MRTILLALFLALAAAPAAAHEVKSGNLHIVHPWARASAGAAKTGAIYMTIRNEGAAGDRLLSAATPIAERAELHTHIMEDGVAKMRPVEALDIGPGSTVELKPSGLHLMLFGLRQRLREYDTFPLTLTFANAGTIEIEVYVEEAGAGEPTH
jgi:copper(I)-binding protein